MKTFEAHYEILPEVQKQVWPSLSKLASQQFVLYGGTAIALRLGHRVSIDFDFFSEKPLDKRRLLQNFELAENASTLQEQENTWVFLAASQNEPKQYVKFSFFGGVTFGRVGTPEFTHDNNICVASLDDLMATKLKVILQRAEAKDYRDIAAMLNNGVDLSFGLAAARQLYGPNFQPSESLKALTYFADGDLSTLSATEKETLVAATLTVEDLPQVQLQSTSLFENFEQ